MDPHVTMPENATKFKTWLKTRGGLAIWRSVNLSNPGASWTTPALTEDGQPMAQPTWQADSKPERVITDITEVVVEVPREVSRFHVGIKRGDSFNFTLTNAATRKVRAACEKAGERAWYAFDYMTQDAIIFVPDRTIPLAEWRG
jgi:hypothetical protein